MIGRQLVELPLSEVNIFPFTSRTLLGTWDTVWGLGRYTATLSASYGPGLVAERTIYFWIMPYLLIMAIVEVCLVILALYIVIRRHLKAREDHRDDEIDELKRKIIEMEPLPLSYTGFMPTFRHQTLDSRLQYIKLCCCLLCLESVF
jgi:hypothetical protein